MLASLLGLTLVSCTPFGTVVADRAEAALAQKTPPLPAAQATAKLAALDARTAQILKRRIDPAHPRSSTEEQLELFAEQVESYTDLLPRLSKRQALKVLATLADLTEKIEAAVDVPPSDWPQDTWREYRDALGCQSHGRGLLELAARYAWEHDIKDPLREKISERLRELDSTEWKP